MKNDISRKEFVSLFETDDFKERFSNGTLSLFEMMAVCRFGDHSTFYNLFSPFHDYAKKEIYGKGEPLRCLIPEELGTYLLSRKRKFSWVGEICWPYLVTEKVIELLVKKAIVMNKKGLLWQGSASYGMCGSYQPSIMNLISDVCPHRDDLRIIVMEYFKKISCHNLVFCPIIHSVLLKENEMKMLISKTLKGSKSDYDTKTIFRNLATGKSNVVFYQALHKFPTSIRWKVLKILG